MNFKDFHLEANRTFHVFETPDCNMVDPALHFGNRIQTINYHVDELRLQQFPPFHTLSINAKEELKKRIKEIERQRWVKQYEQIIKVPLPIEIDQLFVEVKKKAQQKLIKAVTFKSEMFMSVPIFAWVKYKMPYSKFTVDFLPKELNGKQFPAMLHKRNDGEFDYIGQTDMSKAEMHIAIEKRNRVISEFIGDEKHWYCFFRTLAGIKGLEQPHVGQPHLHYISSAWGISRDKVISNLSSYRYNINADTIPFDPAEWLDEVGFSCPIDRSPI